MERNTNRLIALISQILDFRQTETKGFSLDFTRVNITAVLEETFLSFNAMAKKKNLGYHFHHPDANIYAMADEEALNKIFSNLISNAVKYGKGQVYVTLLQPKGEEDEVVIQIANDGPLIPEEMKERIFEPFYRLKETIRQKGTGIGLALARSLVTLHKGQLILEDTWPGMNIFTLVLPRRPGTDTKKKNKTKTVSN